jgi:DNA-binding response OmpR family regulator
MWLADGQAFMNRLKFVPPAQQKTWEIDEEIIDSTRSVLLVEDDLAFAGILKDYLESYNYSVAVAPDGVQGMKRVMEKDFDVILCDLLMPHLPGDMFYLGVERVKPQLARRFIFITGHQSNGKVAEFLKKVRALTLFKPFDMHLLLETMLVAIRNAEKAA